MRWRKNRWSIRWRKKRRSIGWKKKIEKGYSLKAKDIGFINYKDKNKNKKSYI